MKRLFAFLVFILILSACKDPSESLSKTFVLNDTGWLSIPYEGKMAQASLFSDDYIWTAHAEDSRILTQYDFELNRMDRISLYLNPPPAEIDNIESSADGSRALFTVNYNDGTFRQDVCRIVFGTSNHEMFTLDGALNALVPNPLGLHISSISYPSNNQLVYLGTEYDTLGYIAYQNIYIYNFVDQSTQIISLTPGSFNLDWNFNLMGNYFVDLDARINDDGSGLIETVVVSQRIESANGVQYSFKMYNRDGSLNFDGSQSYRYDEIGGLCWLNQDELLLAVKEDGAWKILKGSNSGVETLFEDRSGIYKLKGLKLSPSGDFCITQVQNSSGYDGKYLIQHIP